MSIITTPVRSRLEASIPVPHRGARVWAESGLSLGVVGGKAGAVGEMGSHRVQSMQSGTRGPGSWVLLIGRWFLVVIVVGLVVSWSPPSLLFGPQSAVPGSSRCHQPSSRFCAPSPPPLAILHPCSALPHLRSSLGSAWLTMA